MVSIYYCLLFDSLKKPEIRGIKHRYLEILVVVSSPEFGSNALHIPFYFAHSFES